MEVLKKAHFNKIYDVHFSILPIPIRRKIPLKSLWWWFISLLSNNELRRVTQLIFGKDLQHCPMIHSALPTLLAFPTPSLLYTHLNVCQRAEVNSSTYDDVNVPQHLVRTFMGQGFCWSLQVPNRQHYYTQLVVARVGASATHPFAIWGFQFFLPRHTLRISPDISVVVLPVKGTYYLLPTLFSKVWRDDDFWRSSFCTANGIY